MGNVVIEKRKVGERGKLVVFGSGESGTGAAILAQKLGYDVFVTDNHKIKPVHKDTLIKYGIDFEEEGHNWSKISEPVLVVKSPGISRENTLVQDWLEKGIEVIGEVEFAYRHKGDAKIIAVTGTNGKSTTTALTYHIFSNADFQCAMVGNIGISFARQVAIDPKPLYILEISSYQLDDTLLFRPDVAVLLNITPDHLARYGNVFQNYVNSKFRIIQNQLPGSFFIYNADDGAISSKIASLNLEGINLLPFSVKQTLVPGAFINQQQMTIQAKEEKLNMDTKDLSIKGKHNHANSLAAGLSASAFEIRKQKIKDALTNFKGLEHRCELVTTIKGIDFYNDSKATNVNSTWFALESMVKPVVLILGGVDKNNDYSEIENLVKQKVKALVCLGINNKKIIDYFSPFLENIIETDDMRTCVETCYSLATDGDVVLLSPACASFDLFNDFEERGNVFKQIVKSL